MSVMTAKNIGQLNTTPRTDDKFSDAIWGGFPLDKIRDGETPGIVWEFNFDTMPKTPATTEGNFGLFTQFSDTGGFINAVSGHGWSMGSDGDNEGASIRSRSTPFRIDRSTRKLGFEVQVAADTIADTKNNILTGLIVDTAFSATVPITAAGAVADTNVVYFRRTEAASGGALIDFGYKASGVTAVTIQAAIATLVANTFVNLGFVFEPAIDPYIADPNNTGVNKYNLTSYVNGVRQATAKQIPVAQGTDFPNGVFMGFFFAVLNATGTTPGAGTVRRARVAQLFAES